MKIFVSVFLVRFSAAVAKYKKILGLPTTLWIVYNGSKKS